MQTILEKRKSLVSQSFSIVNDLTAPGLYDLVYENDVNGGIFFHADDRSLIYQSRQGTAFINITRIDTINQIVSGEFY